MNMVVNAYRDNIARLDILEPVRVRNIPLEILVDINEEILERTKCIREIKEKCKMVPLGMQKVDPSAWRG